jgi:uncharacterized membrane protein
MVGTNYFYQMIHNMKVIEFFCLIYFFVSIFLFFVAMFYSWRKSEKQKSEMLAQHGKPQGQFN